MRTLTAVQRAALCLGTIALVSVGIAPCAQAATPAPPTLQGQLTVRPLTAQDVARGRALFLGRQRLASGAPSCVSCHAVGGLGALGTTASIPDTGYISEVVTTYSSGSGDAVTGGGRRASRAAAASPRR